jgi:predicted MFS family arabinose efflux permease
VNRLLLPLLHFFNDGYQAALPLLLPFIAKDIGLSLSSIGFLGSMLNFSSVVLALPAGMIAARFGSKKVLHLAIGVYAAAYLVLSQSTSYIILLIAIALASFGFGIFHPVAFCAVARSSNSSSNLGKEMGTFTATGDIGRIALAASITFLVAAVGWGNTALIYGGFALLLFLALFKADTAEAKTTQESKKQADRMLMLKNHRFLLASACSVLDSMASSSIFIFLPFLLIFREIDYALLGSFSGAFFVGNLLGKTILGWLVDRTGSARIFITAEILMAITLVALAQAVSFPVILALAIILGLLTKGTVPITATMVAQSVQETGDFEAAYSINSFMVGIANTIAPLGLGWIAEFYGIQAVFITCAGLAVLATVPLVFVRAGKKHNKV